MCDLNSGLAGSLDLADDGDGGQVLVLFPLICPPEVRSSDLPDVGNMPVNRPTVMGVGGFCTEKDPRFDDTKETIQRKDTI